MGIHYIVESYGYKHICIKYVALMDSVSIPRNQPYSVVDPIQHVSNLPRTYQYVDSVSKVISAGDNKHRVVNTNYVVTVYDINGQLGKYTSVNQIDYLV